MKKKMIKLMSIALTLVLAFGFILNAKAIEISVDTSKVGTTDVNSALVTNTSTITVNGVAGEDALSAFKILDAYYNSASNVITYEFTTEFKAFKESAEGADYSDWTIENYYGLSGEGKATEFEKLAIKYATYVKKAGLTGTAMTMGNGTATLTTAAGSYLILPTAAVNVYSVMVANLDFVATGNEWQLNTASVNAKASKPTLTAAVNNASYASTSIQKGDVFNYILSSVIPAYPTSALNTQYYMTAALPETISLTGIQNIVVKDGETVLTTAADGTVTKDGVVVATIAYTSAAAEEAASVLTVNFDLSKIGATSVEVTVPVTLNDLAYTDAYLGKEHVSTFKLNYSNDPYAATGESIAVIEASKAAGADDIQVYTYGMDITLTNADGTKLQGGSFTICEDATCTKEVAKGLTTDENGFVKFAGLKDATYYVRQDTAPTGYRLMTTIEPVEVGPVATGKAEEDGYYSATFTNAAAGILPSTGGVGTLVFTVIGILVIGVAFYFVIVYRRKNKDKEEK